LQRIPKNLSHYATVIMTDEYNTSKVCPDCKTKSLRPHTLSSWEKTSTSTMKTKGIGTLRRRGKVQVRFTKPKRIFKLQPVYKRVTKACFRVLACAKHCTNAWIKHRDWVAASNIAEACLEELLHGRRPAVLKHSSVEQMGHSCLTSTTQHL
jgi:hypothetical protein